MEDQYRAVRFPRSIGALAVVAVGFAVMLPLLSRGSSHTLVRTVTLKPTADATFFDNDPITAGHFTVRGNESVLIAGQTISSGGAVPRVHTVSVPLLKFNIETLRERYVPRAAQVAEATLVLRQVDEIGWGRITLVARPLTEEFLEVPVYERPLWNNSAAPVTERYTSGSDTVHFTNFDQDRRFDVTTIVRAWMSGDIPNHGLALVKPEPYNSDNSNHSALALYSRESSRTNLIQDWGTGLSPKLEITYFTRPPLPTP
ncbi:MAG: hypothetical protein G01um1014106_95 [Parcubacteria group bacterium Gr01-1014_106]|nr:MAG: hypothetical protein G01um1014106_95 [Parcubacteria group bacterium Gr01-1014_106]